jgi:hypothetical protein
MSAIVDRRWREVLGWVAGASLYAAYYAWHLISLRAEQLPTDLAQHFSWVQFGGLPFLIATFRWHGWLMVIPQPFTAIALVLVLAGLANSRAPIQLRLAGAAYVALFLVVGQRFNDYWGLLAWPIWALACGYGVQTIHESVNALRFAVARPQ